MFFTFCFSGPNKILYLSFDLETLTFSMSFIRIYILSYDIKEEH